MILSRPVFTRTFDQSAQVSRPHFVASINARISATRHAVVRGPSLTAGGYRPSLTPCHHEDLETGNMARMAGSRMKPSAGRGLLSLTGSVWTWLVRVIQTINKQKCGVA